MESLLWIYTHKNSAICLINPKPQMRKVAWKKGKCVRGLRRLRRRRRCRPRGLLLPRLFIRHTWRQAINKSRLPPRPRGRAKLATPERLLLTTRRERGASSYLSKKIVRLLSHTHEQAHVTHATPLSLFAGFSFGEPLKDPAAPSTLMMRRETF